MIKKHIFCKNIKHVLLLFQFQIWFEFSCVQLCDFKNTSLVANFRFFLRVCKRKLYLLKLKKSQQKSMFLRRKKKFWPYQLKQKTEEGVVHLQGRKQIQIPIQRGNVIGEQYSSKHFAWSKSNTKIQNHTQNTNSKPAKILI